MKIATLQLAAALSLVLFLEPPPAHAQSSRSAPIPPNDPGADMLPVRALAQQQTLPRFKVFHEFSFSDRQIESGISWVHTSTPDSGKFYQPNHYDHGNGVVGADVDGDELTDLYFVSQLGPNALYKNLGDGTFRDITDTAGVALAERVCASAAFADVDNDGDPDLFVTTVKMGNVLFLNDGSGRFADATAASGLDYTGHSSGATFFDYDQDGDLDLFLANVGNYTTDIKAPTGHFQGRGRWVTSGPPEWKENPFFGQMDPSLTEQSLLYRNNGNATFEDVSEATGLRDGGWAGDATVTDINHDGYPDIYVLNMQGDDHFYRNEDGKRFVEDTARYFPKTPWGTMGVKFFDFDNDGDQDLILTDMHSDMSRDITPGFEKLKSLLTEEVTEEELQGGDNNIFGNAFYVNQGDGSFVERSDDLGAENYWPWGLSVGDLNADGWQDVLITSSMNFPFRYGINTMLLNNQGEEFLDSEFLLGIEPRRILQKRPWFEPELPFSNTKKPWFTLDCLAADIRHPLCNGRSGRFTIYANTGSRASIFLDIDRDGDLDIVTNEFNDHPQVLVSDLTDKKTIRYLEVKLVGTRSNRDGFGARVTVLAGNRELTRVHDGKSGYLAQSTMPLYFGLGDATRVERVEVVWPSGSRQTVTEDLRVNSRRVIQEP